MYRDFINSMEKNIEALLNERGITTNILRGHYDDWGIVCPAEDVLNATNKSFGILIDSKYYIVSNYLEQKYCTKTTEGKIKFWEYDYKRWFPIKNSPSIIVFARNSSELLSLRSDICATIKDRVIINLQHPILTSNVIPVSLSIDITNAVNITQLNDHLFYSEIVFNKVICPYFVAPFSLADLDTPLKNSFVMDMVFALFSIEKCCQQFIESNSLNEDMAAHHKEKLYTIKTNQRELLNSLGIPETMWDLQHLKRLNDKIASAQLTITDAINSVKIEDKEREIEKEKQRQREQERKRQEQQRQRQQAEIYEEEYDDYDYGYESSNPGILRGIARGVSDYAHERKEQRARKEAAKPHLMGSYGCRYTKYHTCAFCSLRDKCADYY